MSSRASFVMATALALAVGCGGYRAELSEIAETPDGFWFAAEIRSVTEAGSESLGVVVTREAAEALPGRLGGTGPDNANVAVAVGSDGKPVVAGGRGIGVRRFDGRTWAPISLAHDPRARPEVVDAWEVLHGSTPIRGLVAFTTPEGRPAIAVPLATGTAVFSLDGPRARGLFAPGAVWLDDARTGQPIAVVPSANGRCALADLRCDATSGCAWDRRDATVAWCPSPDGRLACGTTAGGRLACVDRSGGALYLPTGDTTPLAREIGDVEIAPRARDGFVVLFYDYDDDSLRLVALDERGARRGDWSIDGGYHPASRVLVRRAEDGSEVAHVFYGEWMSIVHATVDLGTGRITRQRTMLPEPADGAEP